MPSVADSPGGAMGNPREPEANGVPSAMVETETGFSFGEVNCLAGKRIEAI